MYKSPTQAGSPTAPAPLPMQKRANVPRAFPAPSTSTTMPSGETSQAATAAAVEAGRLAASAVRAEAAADSAETARAAAAHAAKATDTWVIAAPGGWSSSLRPVAAVTARVAAFVQDNLDKEIAGTLCITRRWTSCRRVPHGGVATVSASAAPDDAAHGQVTFNAGGGGPVTLLLLGHSDSDVYCRPSDHKPRQPPAPEATAGNGSASQRKDAPARKEAADEAVAVAAFGAIAAKALAVARAELARAQDKNDPVAEAERVAEAIRRALLRKYPPGTHPTLPPEYVGENGSLRSPTSADGVFVEVDGGTRLSGVKAGNGLAVRRYDAAAGAALANAGRDPSARPTGVAALAAARAAFHHSTAEARVLIAPREAVQAVEAILRERDGKGPQWRPTVSEIADAIAPVIRAVGEELNERARAHADPSPAESLLNAILAWDAAARAGVRARGRPPAAFYAPPHWGSVKTSDGELAPLATAFLQPSGRHDMAPAAVRLAPLFRDAMPRSATAVAKTKGRPPSAYEAAVFAAVKAGPFAGFITVPTATTEAQDTAADGQVWPGTPDHRCWICVRSLPMLEEPFLPTPGLEAIVRPPPRDPRAARGPPAGAERRQAFMQECNSLGLPVATALPRFQTAANAAHLAFWGRCEAGTLSLPTSRAHIFGDRRWGFRAELEAHRLVFDSVALHLMVSFLVHIDGNPLHPACPSTASAVSRMSGAMEALRLPGPEVQRQSSSQWLIDVAVTVGVTRALLLFDVAAAVGLMRPEILVPRYCPRFPNPAELLGRGDTDAFSLHYVRVFMNGAGIGHWPGGANTPRCPLAMLNLADLGGNVATAVEDTLGDHCGGAVLQAALPALARIGADIATGAHDEESWDRASSVDLGPASAANPGDDDMAREDAAGDAVRAMSGMRHPVAVDTLSRNDDHASGDASAATRTRPRWHTEPDGTLLRRVSEAMAAGWRSLVVRVQRSASADEAAEEAEEEWPVDMEPKAWLNEFARYASGAADARLGPGDDPTAVALLAGKLGVDAWSEAVRDQHGVPYATHAVATVPGGPPGMEAVLNAGAKNYVKAVAHRGLAGFLEDHQTRAEAVWQAAKAKRVKEAALAAKKKKTAEEKVRKARQKLAELVTEAAALNPTVAGAASGGSPSSEAEAEPAPSGPPALDLDALAGYRDGPDATARPRRLPPLTMEIVSKTGAPRPGADGGSQNAEDQARQAFGLREWALSIADDECRDDETAAFLARIQGMVREAGPVADKILVTVGARMRSPRDDEDDDDDDTSSVRKRRRGNG